METEIPKISPAVRQWMPDATEEELIHATERLRGFLTVAYRIFRRLEAEGYYDATEEEQKHWSERKKR